MMIRKLLTKLSLITVISSCGKNDDHPADIPPQPQYQDTAQWYVSDSKADVDIFYIISTEIGDYITDNGITRHFADTYNDSLRAPMLAEMTGVDAIVGDKFNFYSPYYRQCSLQTYADDSTIDARMPLPTEDVRRAFNHYIKRINPSRPFIIAGFSQGAMIAIELLKEMDSQTYSRMIAAYIIGATIDSATVNTTKYLVPAQGADDIGVTICYNSVREPSCALRMFDHSAVCINPVSWTTDPTPATLITETTFNATTKDTLTVRIDAATGLLCVDGVTADDYILPLIGKEGNYHSREIWFYRDCLKANMEARAEKFRNGKH